MDADTLNPRHKHRKDMTYSGFNYDPFYVPRVKANAKFSDKAISLFKEPHKELREFSIKGHKVMAYSRKDAITRLKHQKKI